MNGTSKYSLKPLQALTSLFFLNAFSTAALACSLCHTETGKQVRSGIFGPDFGFNLLVTVMPFVIFLVITALIYFGVPGHRNGSKVYKLTDPTLGSYRRREIS